MKKNGMNSLLQSENIELRRMVSDLTKENVRLKFALSEGINFLNMARLKLEVSMTPRPFREVLNSSIECNTEDEFTDTGKLSVIGSFLFRRLEVRMLSDGTLEADTPDGPLRFEDMDHLNEVFASKWPRYDEDVGIDALQRDVARRS